MTDAHDARLNWYDTGLRHLWLPYTQMKTAAPPLPVIATEGSRIILDDERELIDGVAAWWTACHGYNHPHIGMAIARQLERMPHVMLGGLLHEQPARLATRLAKLLPGDLDHVFFSESGSVAVEIAMKMALQYWANRGAKKRRKFVAFKGGYHGDTTGAMAVSDPAIGFHAPFRKFVPKQSVLRIPTDEKSTAAFEQAVMRHAEELAAIIIEPLVQGAGGMKFHDAEVLRRIRSVADRHDLLLIFDEIFTGFGRTGHMFACEEAGVLPDVITLSKALTGGTLPLAATVARKKIFDAFWSDDPAHALMHGPTYMGNALACAAANASLDLFEQEPRLEQVTEISRSLKEGLAPCRELVGVRDIRVKGAIGVVELGRIDDLGGLRQRFIEAGVFIRPFGNIVYLTPSFTIGSEDLAKLTGSVVKVLLERLGTRRPRHKRVPGQTDLPL